jgi:hypothetical protein
MTTYLPFDRLRANGGGLLLLFAIISIEHFRDLEVYQRTFAAAMRIFQLTKGFVFEDLSDFLTGLFQ